MFDEIILSTSLMDKVISLDQMSGELNLQGLPTLLSFTLIQRCTSLCVCRSAGVSVWLCARNTFQHAGGEGVNNAP